VAANPTIMPSFRHHFEIFDYGELSPADLVAIDRLAPARD
jgi:hypothetical protein